MRNYRAYIFGADNRRYKKVAQFASDYANDLSAMKAAEQWEFAPEGDTTSWLLNFYFRRNGTDASAQGVSR